MDHNVTKKKIPWLPIVMVVLAVIVVVNAWYLLTHVFVGGNVYRRNAQVLDVRDTGISVEEYEDLREDSPDSQILWDIPFQGAYYAQDTAHVTVTTLSMEDLDVLDYFTQLEMVDASGCTDYEALMALAQRRPEVQLIYQVTLDGTAYPQDAKEVTLSTAAQTDVELLNYLPQLEEVTFTACGDREQMLLVQQFCRERGISVSVRIDGKDYPDDATSLTLDQVSQEGIAMVAFFPELTKLHLTEPQASSESVLALRETYPQASVTWEKSVAGLPFADDTTTFDLSSVWVAPKTYEAWQKKDPEPGVVPDLEQVETEMGYFPEAEELFFGLCYGDNDALAALREEKREEYKVVWTVQLGEKLTARTDDKSFMPVREGVYYFLDSESYNLRYCEEMECIDVGHMAIHNIDFVEFMPKLKYLILAHTQVQYIEPIKNCKELIFLELDYGICRDFTPLLECTALEDLNIGNSFADLEPIKQMTWLKNLWMNGRASRAQEMMEALPNTYIYYSGTATVAGGWRNLPNYYAMRDALGMPYDTAQWG